MTLLHAHAFNIHEMTIVWQIDGNKTRAGKIGRPGRVDFVFGLVSSLKH